MGTIVGNPFGLVASKSEAEALTESVKTGNEAKFYVTGHSSDYTGASISGGNDKASSAAIVINGCVLRGLSESQETTLEKMSNVSQIMQYKGSVQNLATLLAIKNAAVGDTYNVVTAVTLGNATYPAGTNFCCKTAGTSTGTPAANWDPLGGSFTVLGTKISIQSFHDNNFYSDGRLIIDAGGNDAISHVDISVSSAVQISTAQLTIGSGGALLGDSVNIPLTTSVTVGTSHISLGDVTRSSIISNLQIPIATQLSHSDNAIKFDGNLLALSTWTGIYFGTGLKLSTINDTEFSINLDYIALSSSGITVNGEGIAIKYDGDGGLSINNNNQLRLDTVWLGSFIDARLSAN